MIKQYIVGGAMLMASIWAHAGTMIEVYAPWCSLCKSIEADVLPKVNLQGTKVVKINMDTSPEAAKALGVVGPPTFIFLNDKGEEVSRLYGDASVDDFNKALEASK